MIIECLNILPQFLVERMLGHRVLVAEDDEFHTSPRHRHVHTTEVSEEAYLPLIVGTNQGDEDNISLLSLETIHRVDAYQTTIGLEEVILLDELLEILHLRTIWGNDAHVDTIVQYSLLAYLREVFG